MLAVRGDKTKESMANGAGKGTRQMVFMSVARGGSQ